MSREFRKRVDLNRGGKWIMTAQETFWFTCVSIFWILIVLFMLFIME